LKKTIAIYDVKNILKIWNGKRVFEINYKKRE